MTSFEYTSDRSHDERVDDLGGPGVTTTLTVGNTEYIQRPDGYEIKRYRPGGWLESTHYASPGGVPTGTSHQLLLTDHLNRVGRVGGQALQLAPPLRRLALRRM